MSDDELRKRRIREGLQERLPGGLPTITACPEGVLFKYVRLVEGDAFDLYLPWAELVEFVMDNGTHSKAGVTAIVGTIADLQEEREQT